MTIFAGLASSGVGTKGSVTISSLVSWMGLVTGGWAVVLVLVVEIVRVGADEVKTTGCVAPLAVADLPLDSLAAATSSASRVLKKAVFGSGRVPDEVSDSRGGRRCESVTACGVRDCP